MSLNNSILLTLGLKDENIIFSISPDGSFSESVVRGHDQHDAILYRAYLDARPERCPCCGKLVDDAYLNGTDCNEFTLPSTNGYSQLIALTKQRYKCRECSTTFSAVSPDFIPNTKISRALSLQIFDLLRFDVSESLIAYILHLSHSKVHSLIASAASQYRTDYTIKFPRVISVDEFKYKAHQYAFEMINADTSELIELFPERRSGQLERYLSNYSLEARKAVELVVTDMNANYQTVLKKMFPNAQITIDRFHIVQLAMRAVQSARIKAQNSFKNRKSREYKLLKANWQFFLTDATQIKFNCVRYFRGINEYMYPDDALKLAFATNSDFARTYEIYQSVIQATNYQDFSIFEKTLKTFTPLHNQTDTVISTYKRNIKAIKNSFSDHHSNGRIEGINRRIKQIGRTAYGFRNPVNYFFRIRFQLRNRHGLTRSFLDLWQQKS